MARRLGVIQTPSPTEMAWAKAISERATALGVRVLDVRDGTVPQDVDQDHDGVVLATTQEAAEAALAPTDWLIIRDTPAMARWSMALATSEPAASRRIATTASHRLAIAETAAGSSSAIVVNATDLSVDAPILGRIQREAVQWDGPLPETDSGPLGVLDAAGMADWPLPLFYFPKGNDIEGGGPEIDLTGRARLLMFGPHIHLSRGRWTIDVQLTVEPEQREVPLRLEWGAGTDYVVVSEAVSEAGLYTITLTRDWSVAEAAQFRLWLTQARFQGRLRIVQCQVRRIIDAAPAAEIPSGLASDDPAPERTIASA